MKIVFIVDDIEINLVIAQEALRDLYDVHIMLSAAEMFTQLEKITPDLILLDIDMPDMSGFDTIRVLKSNDAYARIPVIFLTSQNDPDTETEGLSLGAADYILKPFSLPVLVKRIQMQIDLDTVVGEQIKRVKRLQSGIIFVLADIVENRDRITRGHTERTTSYLQILIKEMTAGNIYSDELGKWDLELVISSARLHDVGKITIPDAILNKPARLTAQEFELMKHHAIEGERIIDEISAHAGEEAFLYHAKLFAGTHHEHWDGSGYPRRLKSLEIPLEGRIMAIADVYDALVTERPYKRPFTHEEAVAIICEGTKRIFDGNIVDAFVKAHEKFKLVPKNITPE